MIVTFNNKSQQYGAKALVKAEDTRVIVSSLERGTDAMELEVGNYGVAAFLQELIGECLSSGEDCSVSVSHNEKERKECICTKN